MVSILKYETRRRARSTIALAVGIGAFALMIVWIFPSIEVAGESIEAYVEALPEVFREGFAVQSMTTIEGFLGTELYQFVWLLMLGLYVAYVAGGIVAGDVESGRIDLLLATPISRKRLLVEKYLAVCVLIVALNLVVPMFVFGGVLAIGESISMRNLVALHALSIPYLLTTASIGLALSVALDRADIAQRGSLALLFALFVVDTVTAATDVEFLGVVSPMRYYSPGDILVDGTYDIAGAVLLLLVAFGLLVLSGEWFRRIDL